MQWCDQIFSASASGWCGMPWLTKNPRHVGAGGGTILGHSAFGDRQTKEGGVEAKTCAALSVATCEDCRDDAT